MQVLLPALNLDWQLKKGLTICIVPIRIYFFSFFCFEDGWDGKGHTSNKPFGFEPGISKKSKDNLPDELFIGLFLTRIIKGADNFVVEHCYLYENP